MDAIARRIKELVPQRQKRRRFYFFAFLALAVILVAWTFSALPPAVSRSQSGWLAGFIGRLMGAQVSELLLRKLAHFMIYLMLGAFMGLAITQLTWRKRFVLAAFTLALLAAVIDETIQVFSGRGPWIVDVWIDLAGAQTGLMIVRLFQRRRPG